MGGKEWATVFEQARDGTTGRVSDIAGGSLEQKVEESKGCFGMPRA